MKKDLNYYLGLPYKKEFEIIPEKDGGGVFACIPLLGRASVNGWGETKESAEEMLRDVFTDVISMMIESGDYIPEPVADTSYRFNIPIAAYAVSQA